MAQYLDKLGLQYYHSKITAYVNNKTANMLTKALADTYYAPKDVAATQSAIGLMSAADKKKLDGIASGAQVNTVTGVKGNTESSYRTGNVNITPANVGAIASSEKGAASGVVPLNASSVIDSKYLPSYVDDVLEYSSKSAFPKTGETGKIYVDTSVEENNTYRWSGSTYILIAKNTNTTYTLTKSGSTITLTGSDGSTTSVTDSNTTYGLATASANGLMSSTQFSKLSGIADKANNYVLPTATATVLGGVKSTTTGTTANRNYNVQVNSDGTMKVNVPWVDTNTTYSVATTSSNGLMSKDDKWAFNAICTYQAQSSASVVDSAINPEVWSICTFNGATVVPSSQISTGTVPVTPSAVVVWDGTTGTFVTRTGDDSAYAYYSTVDRSYGTPSDTGAVPFENHIYVNVANDYSLHMYIGGVLTKISPNTISNSEIDTIFA